jgi:hypothetical protein
MKRVIIHIYFDQVKCYSNLKKFCDKNKEFNYDDLTYLLTRKKQPYQKDGHYINRITIER